MNQIEGVGLMAPSAGGSGAGDARRARGAHVSGARLKKTMTRARIYSRPTAGRRASFARAGTSGERANGRVPAGDSGVHGKHTRVGCVYEWIAADGVSRLQRPHPCTVTLWTAFDWRWAAESYPHEIEV